MKKQFCLLLILCHCYIPSFTQETLIHLFKDGTYSRFELAFNDEFDSPALDRSKWMTSYPWGRHLVQNSVTSESLEYYSDGNNCTMRNGILSLEARREKICGICLPWEDSAKVLFNGLPNYRCFDYSSGMVYSIQDFSYGYYELSFKHSKNGKGLWPAFWLFAQDNEIDIFENKGERPNETHWDVHCKEGCKGKKGGWIKRNVDFTSSFNTIGLEWTDKGQRWFHENENYKATNQPFSHKMNIILNLAVARDNDNKGFWVGPDRSTVFPSHFEIDYVKHYRLIESGKKMKRMKDVEIIDQLRSGRNDHFRSKRERPKKKKHIVARIIYNDQTKKLDFHPARNEVSANIYNSNGTFIRKADAAANSVSRNSLESGSKLLLVKAGRKKFAFRLQ